MYSYSHYSMCRGGRTIWPGRLLAAGLLALTLLALCTVAAPGRARAASREPAGARSGPTGPQIAFLSPIYSGQNNGVAEGPVGAVVTVQGSNWAPAGGPVSIDLVDSQLDAAGQAGSACTSATANKRVEIPDLPPQAVDSSGSFTATFTWPAGANTVGHSYWACGGQAAVTFPGTDKYTVLGANPPALSIGNVTSVPVNGSITVKGQNWLPGNQQITVLLVPCLNCDAPPLLTQTVKAAADGTLSVTLSLPAQATIGTTLYVIASNQASSPSVQPALSVNGQGNAPTFTVVDQPTPTPTPSPTPTNTPVPTRAAGGTGTGNTNNGSSNGLLIVLLSALGVVLLLAAVVAVMLFVRSRTPAGPGGPTHGGSGGYPAQGGYSGQYAGPRRTGGSGPPADYTNMDYYNEPPRSGGRSGPAGGYGQRGAGWGGQGGQQGQLPDDSASGDQPTISSPPPWR